VPSVACYTWAVSTSRFYTSASGTPLAAGSLDLDVDADYRGSPSSMVSVKNSLLPVDYPENDGQSHQTGRLSVSRTSFVLWQLQSSRGVTTECSLREWESSGRFQVTLTEAGHMYMWMAFETPVLALEWALSEEVRLIGEGWRPSK
jgi:hypothetical protein